MHTRSRHLGSTVLLPLLVFSLSAPPRMEASMPANLPDAPVSSGHAPAAGLSASVATTYPDTNAPELGMSLTPGHIVIPRLDAAPKLADFTAAQPSALARRMLRIGTFIQRYPNDGEPAVEPTQAYLAYTHDALFVAFVCTDKNPSLIRAHMLGPGLPRRRRLRAVHARHLSRSAPRLRLCGQSAWHPGRRPFQ